nr:WRKY DNA-binding transcription factor 70-like isoform X4 [Lolium perenne]
MRQSKDSTSSSRLVCDNDHDRSAAVLREMAREQSLVTQLRALVLPALQLAGGEQAEVVAHMFESILDCSAKAIAELKLLRLDRSKCDDVPPLTGVDDKRRVRKILSGGGNGDSAKPNRQQHKRRLANDSVTLETPVPHYDGHQWRKYGQKLINNANHPRSYYKCTYKQEQDCGATKTVQQYQQDGGTDDPAMYTVVYFGQHTCKPAGNDTDAAVVKTESTGRSSGGGAGKLSPSDSQCSNISVTCTSVVVDHHQRTASIASNCELLDMAADLENTEVNTYDQIYDEAGFSPFDLDTDWAIDAHGHDLLKYGW